VLLTDVEEVRGRGETDAGRAVGGDGGGEGAHAEEEDTRSRRGGRRPERSCEEEAGQSAHARRKTVWTRPSKVLI
jgi:hypothetical protein